MKVFGIGLNKTGTKTLGECMRILGYRNTSFDPELLRAWEKHDLEPIFRVSDRFDSFEDWPWPLMYKEFDERYPGSKFILTTRRDPETWFESLCRHADMTGPTEARRIAYGFEMPHGRKDHHIRLYLGHIASVTGYFRSRPGQLLEVCWETGSGWTALCGFLGIPKPPEIPFPHKNPSMNKPYPPNSAP